MVCNHQSFLPGSQLLLSETGLIIAAASCLAGVMLWIRVLASLVAASANATRPCVIRRLKKRKKERKIEGQSAANRG